MAETEQVPQEVEATEEEQTKTEISTTEETPEVEEESEDEAEYECPDEFNERVEMCKMFVGGLEKDTSDEDFKGLFASFGEIKDSVIIRKDNNRSDRYFGFITFSKCDDLEECLLARPHNYKEKELDVKRAVPRTGQDGGRDNPGHFKVKKLHVANIPEVFDIKTLKSYLKSRHPKKFGKIEEINLLKAKDADGNPTDKNRGFGFITVSSEDFADRIVIAETKFKLEGIAMRISKAKPRSDGGGAGGRGGRPQQGGGYGGYDAYAGYGGYGGYGGYDAYAGYGGYGSGYGFGADMYGNYRGGYGPQQGRGGSRYKPY